jgi:hypothetical protein
MFGSKLQIRKYICTKRQQLATSSSFVILLLLVLVTISSSKRIHGHTSTPLVDLVVPEQTFVQDAGDLVT